MSPFFTITITSPFRCSLKQRGEDHVRLFSDPEEALAYIARHVPGENAQVTITDQLTGDSRRILIEPGQPLPPI